MPPKAEEPEAKVPPDLRKALAADASVKALWKDLTPLARRDFILWIEQPKLPETRKRRVDSIGSRLKSGKRRPCCFAIVPMNLYKALGAAPKAKAQWDKLTPIERRELASWIDAAKEPEEHRHRINKVREMLAAGKRRP